MKVIVTGGGTGGHIYPALAIAEAIKDNEDRAEILYVGSNNNMEARIVPESGFDFVGIPSSGFDRGYGKLKDMAAFMRAGIMSTAGVIKASGIIRKFKPDAVIATGGFVSLPVVVAANLRGVPVYIHEQNAIPGMTNKMASKKAGKIFLAFSEARSRFGKPERCVHVGNPVREEFRNKDKSESRRELGISEDEFMLIGFGGSLGSRPLNELFLEYINANRAFTGKGIAVGTGKNLYDEFRAELDKLEIGEGGIRCDVRPYIDNMADMLAAADFVICRAGAISLAELAALGKPALLIPLPIAAENHQYYNALALADKGAAILVEEKDLNPKEICEQIGELARDPQRLSKMSECMKNCDFPDAAEKIYLEIKKDLGK